MQLAKTILLIDDDADDRSLFAEALSNVDEFCRCSFATNGEQALELLHTTKEAMPDFIFLDLNMPRMNGWQCLSKLREITALNHVPVIIYSTSSTKEDEQKAEQLGAAYFLTKPAKFKDLVHAIFFVLNKNWLEIAKLNDMGRRM